MGKQVLIAQSQEDEKSFIEWLSRKYTMLTIPRILDDPILRPVQLGQCKAIEQLVFPEEVAPVLVTNVYPVVKDNGHFQVLPKVRDGLCFEWLRTVTRTPETVIGGYAESRIYYIRSPEKENAALVNRIVNSVLRYVRERYPLVTKEKPTRYIAPDFASSLLSGALTLVYPNGKKVSYSQNPKCKSPI